jgi:hypothetical protein
MDLTKPEPDSALVEAIAARVVELLDGAAPDDQVRLVDAGRVARELGVERDWVYDHAKALGAIRLGGPRGRLRFDLQVVKERLGGSEPSSWRAPRRPARRAKSRQKAGPSPPRRPVKSRPTRKVAGARANAPGLTPGGSPMQTQDIYARSKSS